MNKTSQIVLLICLHCLVANAQDIKPNEALNGAIHYLHYSERITPFPSENRFEVKVEAKGELQAEEPTKVTIPLHGTETVEELKIYYKDAKGKQRRVKGKRVMAETRNARFYESGYQSLQFELPVEARSFSYTYRKETAPILLLAQFPLFAKLPTDTLSYCFDVPDNYHFKYDYDKEANLRITIDGSQAKQLKIQVRPRVNYNTKKAKGILAPDFRLPYLQVRLEENDLQDSQAAFIKEYWDFLKPTQNLSPKTLDFFKQLSAEMGDSMQVVTVFKEVRNRIRYLKDPNDIQAILPEEVEEVWRSKMGDCKDMSNLLYSIYKGMGFETYLVLTATRDHHFQGNFPSLGAYNHLAVLVRLQGEDYFMDATGPFNLIGYPISAVQGQPAVALGEGQYFATEIPVIPKEENDIEFHLYLKLGESYKGKSQFTGKYFFNQNGCPAIAYLAERKKSKRNYPLFLTNLQPTLMYIGSHNFNDGNSSIKGEAFLNMVVTDVEKVYLSLDVLAFPHEFPQQVPSGFVLSLPHAVNNSLHYTLDFGRPISLKIPPPVNYSKDGMGFTLEIKQKEKDTLYISYRFTNDNIRIDDTLAGTYHEINELVKQTFKQVLLIE